MVKGVNKTVIEINDTGSQMFERVVLFVSPQYGNISTKRLNCEARSLIRKFDSDYATTPSVRERFRQRRRVRTVLCVAALILLSATILFLIL